MKTTPDLVASATKNAKLSKTVPVSGPAPAKPGQRYTSEEKLITPAIAQRYLDRIHPNQRSVNRMAVARYTAAMKAGKWEHNHQNALSIQDGFLIDGQHRLLAVVASGMSLWMLVHKYEPGTTVGGIDRTHPRNLGDHFDMSGVTQRGFGRKFAAIARMVYTLSRDGGKDNGIDAEIQATMVHNEAAIKSVWAACGDRVNSETQAAFVYAYPIAPEAIIDMIRRVRDADNLAKNTGAWNMSRMLSGAKVTNKTGYGERAVRSLKCIMLELQGEVNSDLKHRVTDNVPDSILWARKARVKAGACPLAYPGCALDTVSL